LDSWDNRDRAVQIGWLCQDREDRTEKTGQRRQDRGDRTEKTGQLGQDSQDRTGDSGQDSREMKDVKVCWTGQPEQLQPGQDSKDITVMTELLFDRKAGTG
jgi:hypothetical protein